jgi:RNA 3'-terminal phosphate cyclase (ATP)
MIIEIDGSYGESGGQILRTAVALSALTGKSFKIYNIRAKRRNPGIQTQHLEAIKAVAKLCNAETKGAEKNSIELEFYPKKLEHKDLSISISTAGSVSLVLQSLIIATANIEKEINIKISGGATYGKWAPTINYLKYVTLPILRKIGYNAEIDVNKHGFYPTGGADVNFRILPHKINFVDLLKRGRPIQIKCFCIVSKDLEKIKVGERMKKEVKKHLFRKFNIIPEIEIEYVNSLSSGGGIDLFIVYENSIIGSNSIIERGKTAEKIAKETIYSLVEQHNSNAPLDEHMGDQIIPFMALSVKENKVMTTKVSNHAKTNMWVVEKFLPVKFEIEEKIIKCLYQT